MVEATGYSANAEFNRFSPGTAIPLRNNCNFLDL